MHKAIKSFSLHPFLVPLFFILHKLNEYFFLISVPVFVHFTLYYVFLSAILLLLTRLLVFRSITKSGILVTIFLIVFYFFGTTQDLLKKAELPSLLTSYKVLLAIVLIILSISIFYIKKSAAGFKKLNTYLNILFALLLCLELLIFLFRFYNQYEKNNNLAQHDKPAIQTPLSGNVIKPDIFFIVFDEYSSTLNLKKYFNFKNDTIDSTLKTNHFYLASNSSSNYNGTQFSLSTTFNMNFFNIPLEQKYISPVLYLQGWNSLKQTSLSKLLENNGYTICNFGLCELNNYPAATSDYSTEYQEKAIFEETLWGRVKKDIFWNITTLKIGFVDSYFARKVKERDEAFVAGNLKNLDLALKELNKQTEKPKFVFAHVMMPHFPFLLDRNGNYLKTRFDSNQYQHNRKAYLEQIMYSNKWIEKLSKSADQEFPRPRVVIIEGDHGFRDFTNKSPRESYFRNLNAFYFSDRDYSMLYDSISPVNSFRVVLNKYFKEDMPLLKDSTVYLIIDP